VTTTATTAGTCRYTGSYPAEPVQVRQVRVVLAALLRGCPRADDAILVASEYVTNSIVHSASHGGGEFTLRAEVEPSRLRIEVEDAGGPWHAGPGDDDRPHGFDVVAAIAGSQNWGVNGDADGRIAWAALSW
jgi:anti-sigma regulatory factor (Ser/Thr protein kinase)